MIGRTYTLYRFFDAEGALVYTDIAENHRALFTALREKAWWPSITNITAEHFDTREAAAAGERLALKQERPKFKSLACWSVRKRDGVWQAFDPEGNCRFASNNYFSVLSFAQLGALEAKPERPFGGWIDRMLGGL